MATARVLAWSACLVAMAVLIPGGCTVTLDPTNPADPNTGGDDGGGDNVSTLTIRIVNSTPNTLDPQIYIANEPVDLDTLFDASRKYTNYGVGRLGLLARNSSDSFMIDCADARVIGTRGGSFGGDTDGNDLNNPAGSGRQLVLTQELVFFCGDEITFTYSESGDGFTTSFDISP